MYQILIGSALLSLIHAMIPNHWIPLIAISKTEKWTQKETLLATLITGFAHTLSTVIIGVIVGFVGLKLTLGYENFAKIAAPAILFIIGSVYLIFDLRQSHNHHHKHHHHSATNNMNPSGKRTSFAIIISLSIAMFLTPCIEIEAYYFQASLIGWAGIITVSLVYMFITLLVMFILVYLGLRGIDQFNSHYLEHHEKGVTGIVMLILGLLGFFIKL